MAAGVVAGIVSQLYLVVSLQLFRYEIQTGYRIVNRGGVLQTLMNLSQETTVFWRAPEIDFRCHSLYCPPENNVPPPRTKFPREICPSSTTFTTESCPLFSGECPPFLSLHREPPEVGLVEKLIVCLYW